jgi:hypothetical protein
MRIFFGLCLGSTAFKKAIGKEINLDQFQKLGIIQKD